MILVTPDDAKIVSGSYDHTIRILDISTENITDSFIGDNEITAYAITPTKNMIVADDFLDKIHFLKLEE